MNPYFKQFDHDALPGADSGAANRSDVDAYVGVETVAERVFLALDALQAGSETVHPLLPTKAIELGQLLIKHGLKAQPEEFSEGYEVDEEPFFRLSSEGDVEYYAKTTAVSHTRRRPGEVVVKISIDNPKHEGFCVGYSAQQSIKIANEMIRLATEILNENGD